MRQRAQRLKQWATPLRIALSTGLLWFLFVRVGGELSLMIPRLNPSGVGWLTGAAGLLILSYVLSTVRWYQVTTALGLHDGFGRLLSHFLAGQFLSNALPTTIGGDVVRVARLSRDTGDSPSSFASVVLDRLTGWIVLPLITVVGFALNPALRATAQSRLTLTIAGTTFGLLLLVLFAADVDCLGGRFSGRPGWQRFIDAVHLGVGRLRRRPRAALSVIGAGIVYQFVLVAAAFMMAKALDINIGLTAMMAFFPAVLIAQVLPISVSGLGVREFMLVWLLRSVGVFQAQAIALGLVVWAMTVVTSLIGAPSYAFGARSSRPMREELVG
jgi:uncharacterized membrane protein YbhN (UPF0104 family)